MSVYNSLEYFGTYSSKNNLVTQKLKFYNLTDTSHYKPYLACLVIRTTAMGLNVIEVALQCSFTYELHEIYDSNKQVRRKFNEAKIINQLQKYFHPIVVSLVNSQ